MYINQNRYNEAMSYKQNDANVMIKRAEGNKDGTSTVTPGERYHALCTIYNFYSPNMCQRFGTARVMSAYDYSAQVTDITATVTARSSSARCCSTSSRSPPACSVWSSAAWPLTARSTTWKMTSTASVSCTVGWGWP